MRHDPTDSIDAELTLIAARRARCLDLVRRCHDELIAGYRRESELLLQRHELAPPRPMIHR